MARKLELRLSSDHQRQCGKLVAFFHLHFDAETVGMQTVVSTHSNGPCKNIAICDLSDTSQKRESAESVSQLICYGRKKIVFNMRQCCGFEIEGDDLFLAQAAIYEDSQKMWISLPTDLLCNLDPCSVLLVKIESIEILMEFDRMLHKVVCQVASVHPKDSDAQPGGVDNMTKLARLHEPGVVYNLASRYELDNIYVSAALSHYASVYTGNILIAVNPFAKLPHLAGKTELIMKYLAYIGGLAATDGQTVERQVLEV
ncbi:unnamed protein product [Sphagnum troendelagicum]